MLAGGLTKNNRRGISITAQRDIAKLRIFFARRFWHNSALAIIRGFANFFWNSCFSTLVFAFVALSIVLVVSINVTGIRHIPYTYLAYVVILMLGLVYTAVQFAKVFWWPRYLNRHISDLDTYVNDIKDSIDLRKDEPVSK